MMESSQNAQNTLLKFSSHEPTMVHSFGPAAEADNKATMLIIVKPAKKHPPPDLAYFVTNTAQVSSKALG